MQAVEHALIRKLLTRIQWTKPYAVIIDTHFAGKYRLVIYSCHTLKVPLKNQQFYALNRGYQNYHSICDGIYGCYEVD